jgi:tetratricopeptide (TPR) repeat protein
VPGYNPCVKRAAALILLATACAPRATPIRAPIPTPTLDAAADGAGPLPFIVDAYAAARAQARARGVPLLVEAWAPWCHSCQSMRQYVLPDPALRRFATRFVWASLDTEREVNAPAVTRFEVRSLPTLLVIDPVTERARLTWVGSMTAPELADLLDATLAAGPDGATALDPARALDAMVTRASEQGRLDECVSLAADRAPALPPGTPLADVVRTAMECAGELPAASPGRARLGELTDRAERLADDPALPVLADDRSDLYAHVVDGLRSLGRSEEVRRVGARWSAFLEREAARAPSPGARAVFDSHRLLAAEAAGDPTRAIPVLEQSERDFPGDYNPPARLGALYFSAGRYDEALAALDRALARAYGPRRLRLWSLQVDVLLARGDRQSRERARRVLADAVAAARTMPMTGHYPQVRASLERRLAELGGEPPPVDAGAPSH